MAGKYIESYEIDDLDRPLTVVFVRHGQPEDTKSLKRLGPALSSLGKRQANRVAKRLSGEMFDHIYASDLARAYDTAQAIIPHHKDTEFTVDPDLREIVSYHFLPDIPSLTSGQRENMFKERDSIDRFANHLRHEHSPGERILVVCHGNLIRTMIPVFGGREPRESILIDLYHTSVSILEVWPSGEAILKLGNCVNHLLTRQIT